MELEQYFIDNLDKAIANGWIEAYHQPLVRAASGKVSDEEAFARWIDPELGSFNASEFIPVLEENNLSYKLDLYMVEKVLNKMKGQGEHGLYIVPESVNLSRSDFDCCDMVKEIADRIDASGLSRDKLSVELSERTVSSDTDFIKEQVNRFQAEGIKVWMDDYGSGYTSLLLLLKMRFDLLKIDKVFIDQIEVNENGQIILTELIKTALALHMDTVAEGVETKRQADFLKEIGCTKLQGYYFTKPISLEEIFERNRKGIQIGFENPKETDYFDKVGRINLYDLSISNNDDQLHFDNYFDTMPMAIFELDSTKAKFIRGNKSYRKFVLNNFYNIRNKKIFKFTDIKPGEGLYSFNAVRQCAIDGNRRIIDDRMPDGRIIQLLIRRIALNQVTSATSVVITVLSVSDYSSSDSINYNYIARALSEDYINLYFVDMDTERFTEFASDGVNRDISLTKKGNNFFDFDRNEFDLNILPEDKKNLKKVFTKEIIRKYLEKDETYSIITRILLEDKPVFVNIKVVKVRGKDNKIIIGINNVDAEIKAREYIAKAKEAEVIYSRIGALTGDYLYIFTVDPVTNHYNKYSPTNIVSDMTIPDEGGDFFEMITKKSPDGIYSEDVGFFLSAFSKESILSQIKEMGMYETHHRLNIDGTPRYVAMKATMVHEDDKDKLIVGVLDIDERIKREKEFADSLFAAETKASIDDLTGVKNKNAYADTEKKMNELIEHEHFSSFAIAVFDINGLKEVNDTMGHQAGDEFIKRGCDTICRTFKHSPVFRIGGDEFVVIVQGYDFLNIESIMARFKKHNIRNQLKGDVVIASGISKYNNDGSIAPVFKRADSEMYINKRELKRQSE